jgi:hypothetical protein
VNLQNTLINRYSESAAIFTETRNNARNQNRSWPQNQFQNVPHDGAAVAIGVGEFDRGIEGDNKDDSVKEEEEECLDQAHVANFSSTDLNGLLSYIKNEAPGSLAEMR